MGGMDAVTHRPSNGARAAFAGLIAACLMTAPPEAHAMPIQWRGLLDLVAAERTAAYSFNRLTPGDNSLDAYRLRLFANAQVNDHLQVLAQVLLDDNSGLFVDGAYAIYTPAPARDLHLEVGKIPWAVGTYAPRTHSDKNPLIGTPLMYSYHTSMIWYQIVPTADAMLNAAGTGSTGVDYFGYAVGMGMPIVDDSYWDVGATLIGSARPFEFTLGMTNGTPGWGSTTRDDNSGKSVLGRVGLAPVPALRFGVSGSYGPYLVAALDPRLPAGHTANDYHQKLAMADLELLVGQAELRAEGVTNVWETPLIGDLRATSGYAELKYSVAAGLYAAGRWDVEQFSRLTPSSGMARPWDWNVTRLEAGFGYRFTREARAKLVYQRSRFENATSGGGDRVVSALAAQLSFGF